MPARPNRAKDLPLDPLSRQPFTYRREADGGFTLEGAQPEWDDREHYIWTKRMGR